MIKILIIFIISWSVWGSDKIQLLSLNPVVKQGEITDVKLKLSSNAHEIQKLSGQTLGEILYIMQVSPPLLREGQEEAESEAKVIFTQVPKDSSLVVGISGQSFTIDWTGITVSPTQAQPSLVFGSFEIPKVTRWILWSVLTLIIGGLIAFFGHNLFKKIQLRNAEKNRLKKIKEEILSASQYEDVVNLWKRKHDLITVFPHVREPFLKLESVLNRHQFKPRQSEAEKIEVKEAYRKFQREVEGGFIGV